MLRSIVLCCASMVMLCAPALGAEGDIAEVPLPAGQAVDQVSTAKVSGNPAQSIFSRWPDDLILAPVPGYSSELGWTLALGAGYFLPRKQKENPASLVGVMAMGSENDSHALGAGGSFHLLNDRLRLVLMLGDLKFNYRFWGIGNDAGESGRHLNISQTGQMFYSMAMWEWFDSVYAGVGLLGGKSEVTLRGVQELIPQLPDPSLDINLGALELPLQHDDRDDVHFPRKGVLAEANAYLYRDWLSSDFNADIFKLDGNVYLPIGAADVLALRAMYRSASDDAPFFLLSSFGGKTDLRGYDTGRYRDTDMYAVQGEYRWRASDSWVLTGFAGVGEVASSPKKFFSNFLPAAGVGARYMLSRKHQVSLSADWAVGKNGSEFYFGVGEAF
ncbi:BamA/TamA family outer membrane protein [Gilvimarinus sp. DA14]|uniref:BamA/TamA family outer membrane protein n=1 Tax=Gilvimarinus sp. DA14 TaxID=2956798 RepID=UPI0020B736CC|nr:BamA/TamA family outer membrane protein [Gilvimarinus sp. DA14]UTF61193.1 BamA/TamA family outer membrane protein [Gilvimarinus sp. DA14]